MVGDDDQSIYGWRGAEIANLLDLEKHFPEVKVVKLEQNYRSTNTILNAANALIKNNARRRAKAALVAARATARRSPCAPSRRTRTRRARWWRRSSSRGWPTACRGRDHAILFRTNQQSRPLETALRPAGVRYHLIGGQSFFDRREVRDFLAYLKTFLNPHDDISLLRIANVPARGLSDVTMERLLGASHERKCSVFAAMKNPAVTTTFQTRTRESIEAFVEFIERTRAAACTPASDGHEPQWPPYPASLGGAFPERDRLPRRTAPRGEEPRGRREPRPQPQDLIATMDRQRAGKPVPARAAGEFSRRRHTRHRPRGGGGKQQATP